jgi:DNA-directed RNA polymerase specialized sigma24 family protein
MRIASEMEFVPPDAGVLIQTGQAQVEIESLTGKEKVHRQKASTHWIINQNAFDELLCWLDPDPVLAGRQYEFIRRKLIKLFTYKGCMFPEDLADETFDRVAKKLPQIRSSYIGNPAKYFYGVAKKVYREYLHNTSVQHFPPNMPVKEDLEELLEQLDYALSRLGKADRELILSYYQGDGRSKVNRRKALAQQLGLNLNTLRMRVYRIRSHLRNYFDIDMR